MMRDRQKETLKRINAAIHDGVTPPIDCIHDFMELTTRATFDEIFALLDPKLQTHVGMHAKDCAPVFEEIIAECRTENPSALEPWLAFKEWAERQSWWQQARNAPPPIKWTEEQSAAWLEAERAKEVVKMAHFFARDAKSKDEGLMWKRTIDELQTRADEATAQADAAMPRRRHEP